MRRAKATIQAQYAVTSEPLLRLIQEYSVDYVLLDRTAFTPEYLANKKWLIYSSWQDVTQEAIASIKQKKSFILPPLVSTCSVVTTESNYLLDTQCINYQLSKSQIKQNLKARSRSLLDTE